MDRDSFAEALTRCCRKAFLDVTWTFSSDEDEDARICLDRNGYLIVNDVTTPYNVEDVERVKYGIDEFNDDYYFSVCLKGGSRLRFGEINGNEYILLQPAGSGGIRLYPGGPADPQPAKP